MNQTIHIPPGEATTAAVLLYGTSLNDCTTWRLGDDGITVEPNWAPAAFSSGEKELWHALGHLAAHGTIPTLDDRHLDSQTRETVQSAREVLFSLRGVA